MYNANKMNARQLREYILPRWQPLALYGALAVVLGVALLWRLGSLTHGYSAGELATFQTATGPWKNLLANPLDAPFLLPVRALHYILHNNLIAVRVVAAAMGVVTLGIFAVVLRQWHNRYTTFFGTLLFGLSAWFLHTARLGTPDVLLFGIFALAACGYWLKQTLHWLPLLICFLLAIALLYVPGALWFVGLGVLWQWKVIDQVFKKHLLTVSLGGLVLLAALAPLGWAIFKHHSLALAWLGLPAHVPPVTDMLKNILVVPFHLFVHNATDPATWLGNASILDVCSLALFVLGGYMYLKRIKLVRVKLFLSCLIVTCVLIAIGSSVTFTIIMPLIYMVIAAGVAEMLGQWFEVFPRNPIARSLGWVSVALIVGLACAYQLTHYFVGWPEAAATRQAFTVQKP